MITQIFIEKRSTINSDYMVFKFNTFYLFLVIIWPMIQSMLAIDGAGRTVIILSFVAIILNVRYNWGILRRVLFQKPIIFWFLWVLYNILNSMVKGNPTELPFWVFIMNFSLPLIVMIVACIQTCYSITLLSNRVLLSMLLLSIWGGSGMDVADQGRIVSDEMGNSLALVLSMVVFISCLLYKRNNMSFKILMLIILFALAMITMMATRKAFGASLLIILMTVLSYINIRSIKNVLFMVLLVFVFNIGMNYIMEKTVMGERLVETEDVGEKYNSSDIEALSFLGDRASMYLKGWDLFLEHPVTGIGLLNYRKFTGSDFVIHSEYVVQLAECGVIGLVLFLSFYFSIIKGLFRYRGKDRLVLLGGIISILFIAFTGWLYSFSFYFIIIGIIIGVYKFDNRFVNKKI